MNYWKPYNSLFLIFALVNIGCSKSTFEIKTLPYLCDTVLVSYQADILPIVTQKCLPCHNQTFTNANYNSYEGLKSKAENGKLFEMAIDLKKMPPNDTLTQKEIQLFDCWIANGYLNN